jgi:hypothetical protein
VSSTLLRQVTQELVGISNGEHLNPPSTDAFKPPRYAIRVNILWFISLIMSLSCGLGATLVQQWVRRYLKLTRHSEMPMHRVRIRTYLFRGMKEFQVRLVVENISLLLHAAIFLFFAGLVEFLFAINHEVAQVVLAVICFFAAFYVVLTSLPVIFQQCPFQTPLTSVFWYMTHIIAVVCLSPFTCSSHIRTRLDELWKHTKRGFDNHIMDAVKDNKNIDKDAVRLTLSMCRVDSDVETFLEAVPGYLQTDYNVGTHIDDIGSLLKTEENNMSLGHRMAHLYSSCIIGDGKMDEVARRHRAVTCSHVIFELSKAISSVTVEGLTLNLPKSIGHKLQHLSRDHDSNIAFAALRTIAVLESALLRQLSVAKNRMDPGRSEELADLLEAAVGEDDPISPRYQAGLRNDDRREGRLIAVTEFTSSILVLIKRPWEPSHQDIEDLKSTYQELCRGLNGSDFSHATQQRFVNVLSELCEAHLSSVSTGTLCDEFTSSLEHWLTSRCPLSRPPFIVRNPSFGHNRVVEVIGINFRCQVYGIT